MFAFAPWDESRGRNSLRPLGDRFGIKPFLSHDQWGTPFTLPPKIKGKAVPLFVDRASKQIWKGSKTTSFASSFVWPGKTLFKNIRFNCCPGNHADGFQGSHRSVQRYGAGAPFHEPTSNHTPRHF